DKMQCSICDGKFDDATHRPRSLPCGHGFCTLCIDSYIHLGKKSCPVCRYEHGANSATNLPINFLLEELLHKVNISASQRHISDTSTEVANLVMCPKHKGIPLYFHCKSHNVKVCHSCAVIDHPPTSCNLISLDDHINMLKETLIVKVQKQNELLKDTEKDLETLLMENLVYLSDQKMKKKHLESEIKLLHAKIDGINQEIVDKENCQDHVNKSTENCQEKQKSLEIMENNLRSASSFQDIIKQCEMANTEILQTREWEKTLRRQLSMRKVR
ncbi:unnamed protein product, partial [Meganyctiphanes norvegica]